jgi:hypothetical protein
MQCVAAICSFLMGIQQFPLSIALSNFCVGGFFKRMTNVLLPFILDDEKRNKCQAEFFFVCENWAQKQHN